MLDRDCFMGMIKAFRMLGMETKEKDELELWFKVLVIAGITQEEFEAGYLELAKSCKTFWKNNNVPAMIIEKAEEWRATKKRNALQERIKAKELSDKQERQKVLAEYNEDPEFFKKQPGKLKQLTQGIG